MMGGGVIPTLWSQRTGSPSAAWPKDVELRVPRLTDELVERLDEGRGVRTVGDHGVTDPVLGHEDVAVEGSPTTAWNTPRLGVNE